jgi:histidyl-tRNA synthetase
MLLKNLGLHERVVLKINSIGDSKSRKNYVQALKSYLDPYKDQLSEFSKLKLDINPIKILDSKFSNDLKLTSNGPQLLDYLNTSSSSHFEELQKELKIQGIPFEVDNNLVRGLDYYNDTVWEFVSKPGEKSLGESQCTVLGGGRYQGLIEKLEGKCDQSNEIPSIG